MEKQDYFSLEKIYPEAGKIFSFPFKSLAEVANDCIFVLDTNVLLIPFDVTEKDFGVIVDVFQKLKEKQRLFLPARVAREFAKNRGEKISQIFLKLRQKQQKLNTGNFSPEKYPILEHSRAFNKLNALNEKIQEDIKKARKLFREVENEILNWNWNDPISLVYRALFSEEIIIEIEESQEDLIKDLNFRIKNSIAPGYKDENKSDKGIGDLIIWKTIIEIGKKQNQNVVFVSNDKKGDWYYRQDNEGIYPKYELFDEFRTGTNGKSINIIDFPKFLEIFKIDAKIINDVKNIIQNEPKSFHKLATPIPIEEIQKMYPGLKQGAVVIHPKFGEGIVINLYGNSIPNLIADVNFGEEGVKKLFLRFTKGFEVLNEN